MKHFAFLIPLLCLLPLVVNSQPITAAGLRLGFLKHRYNINEPGALSLPFNNSNEMSYFLTAFARSSFSESNRFYIGYGLGFRDEIMFLQPLTPFGAIRNLQDLNADSLIVGALDTRAMQLSCPLEFSVKLWDPIGSFWYGRMSGLRIAGGIEGRITFRRVWMNNTVFSDYNVATQRGTEVFDENINFRVNHYYSGRIRQANVLANLGAEFFMGYGPIDFYTGVRINKYMVSPVKFKINNERSTLLYLGIEYVFD